MSYWADKVVLVTGASGSFGRTLAEVFATHGAKVVVSARTRETLNNLAETLCGQGHDVLAVPADLTQQDQVDHLFKKTFDHFGRLDALVNNAGRSARARVLNTTPEDFQSLMDLNLLSVVRCTRAALPHLLQSRGHLINIGSLASKTAMPYMGAYPATKFALAAYTQQLRLELKDQGLHVLLVCPGPIASQQTHRRFEDPSIDVPESARKPGGGAKMRALSPEKVARAILSACERRQDELILPRYVRLLFVISQWWPRLGDWILRRNTDF